MPYSRVCNLIDIPELVKQVRVSKKLSQRKLAQKLSLSKQTIGAYEKGRIQPSLDIFLHIINVGGFVIELKEDIYKTPKKLLIPTSKKNQINNNKENNSAN